MASLATVSFNEFAEVSTAFVTKVVETSTEGEVSTDVAPEVITFAESTLVSNAEVAVKVALVEVTEVVTGEFASIEADVFNIDVEVDGFAESTLVSNEIAVEGEDAESEVGVGVVLADELASIEIDEGEVAVKVALVVVTEFASIEAEVDGFEEGIAGG